MRIKIKIKTKKIAIIFLFLITTTIFTTSCQKHLNLNSDTTSSESEIFSSDYFETIDTIYKNTPKKYNETIKTKEGDLPFNADIIVPNAQNVYILKKDGYPHWTTENTKKLTANFFDCSEENLTDSIGDGIHIKYEFKDKYSYFQNDVISHFLFSTSMLQNYNLDNPQIVPYDIICGNKSMDSEHLSIEKIMEIINDFYDKNINPVVKLADNFAISHISIYEKKIHQVRTFQNINIQCTFKTLMKASHYIMEEHIYSAIQIFI